MDKSLLKKAAIQSVALMIAVVTLSYALKQYQAVTIAASNLTAVESAEPANTSITGDKTASEVNIITPDNIQTDDIIMEVPDSIEEGENELQLTNIQDLKNSMDQSILQQLGENYLIIKKPEGDSLTIQLDDLYINQCIQLVFENMADANMKSTMISRIRGEEIFTGEPVYKEIVSIEIDEEKGTSKEVINRDFGTDLSHGITITAQETDTKGQYSAQVVIQMDSVYACQIYEDPNYYFIDLKKPSEVYDKILVIDAGHGGKDAGAISKGDKYYEKDINLDILLHLKDLLDKENIKVYYTRTADDKVFLRPRVNLANAVDCDYFISIHCNANVVTSPNGTEILYYDNEFKGVKAFHLAKLFSAEIAKTVTLKNKGTVKKHMEDIFIMDKALVPMILIEVGYLTNNSDMNYLSKAENRKAVAMGIYNGIMRAYNELPVTE